MTAAEALQQAAEEGLELQRASEDAPGFKASGDGSGFGGGGRCRRRLLQRGLSR